ncbi:MAG: Holliday junction branch migration protein RuvA [Ectothiorhodospiraceae bacterium]|nr:Holliday junction branch migration protein RuvA [Ectothiorhodospiraceae bacterium]MCH8505679.1 Holliday junction branch migration protein RuvA [Ectothiorhodospiraceae bacterium]
MIGRLSGKLAEKQPPSLLLDVQGVGYELEAPMSTFYSLPSLGEPVMLYTHLVVKEDAHNLYGFLTRLERSLFRSLIRVNGVGPKLGLTLLSGMPVETLLLCIQNQDDASLTRLPGVGKKTAQRLVIDLKDRVSDLGGGAETGLAPMSGEMAAGGDATSDAISALVALGYKPAEASRLVSRVEADGLASEEIIRQALQKTVRQGSAGKG